MAFSNSLGFEMPLSWLLIDLAIACSKTLIAFVEQTSHVCDMSFDFRAPFHIALNSFNALSVLSLSRVQIELQLKLGKVKFNFGPSN